MNVFEFVRSLKDYSNLSDEEIYNLKPLNLSNNLLKSLPESLGNLNNLQRLLLSYNQLIFLPESLGKLSNLQKLWSGNNQLNDQAQDVLKTLVMTNSEITTLITDNFDFLRN